MTSDPSGRGVRGMLNDLLHSRDDDPDDGSQAAGGGREPGRYPDGDRPAAPGAPGTAGPPGDGEGPRPAPRPGPPAPPVPGAHRLADATDPEGSLFGRDGGSPTWPPTFGARSADQWRSGPATPGQPAEPRPPAPPVSTVPTAPPATAGPSGTSGPVPLPDEPRGSSAGGGRAEETTDGAGDRPVPAGSSAPGPQDEDAAPDGDGTTGSLRSSDDTDRTSTGSTDIDPMDNGRATTATTLAAAPPAAPFPAGPSAPAGAAATASGRPAPPVTDAREPLVPRERAEALGSRWDAVKGSFVDDPRDAVRGADGLVGELLDEIDRALTERRAALEQGLDDDGATTEDLRQALRRYRSFFDRLLDI